MRKSRDDYKSHTDPFELVLSKKKAGGKEDVVTFRSPLQMSYEEALEFDGSDDLRAMFRRMLGEQQFTRFWAEWKTYPIEELFALIRDIGEHYNTDIASWVSTVLNGNGDGAVAEQGKSPGSDESATSSPTTGAP